MNVKTILLSIVPAVLIFLLICENGSAALFIKKFFCKFGFHKREIFKMKKYYCQFCKKPRKYPELKVIDGGNKMGQNRFDF